MVLCTAFAFLHCVATAHAQEPRSMFEHKIKAGLVYNFLKYTTWPDISTHKELKVCLFGGDPFDGYLNPLAGRTAQQAKIVISRISSIQETEGCHLVFVHRRARTYLSDILSFLDDKNVLTISDINGFAQQGGMVELATEQQQIRLYINQYATQMAGLNINEQILKLAKFVQK